MIRYLNFLCKLLLRPLYWVSRITPRDGNKWVFGTHIASFSGNTKYLFIKVNEEHPEIKAIWIANSPKEKNDVASFGFECRMWYSPFAVYHCFTAGVYCCTDSVSDINRYASGGTFYVYLGHGVGIKKHRWLRPESYWEKEHGYTFRQLETSFMAYVDCFFYLFRKPDICLTSSRSHAQMIFSPMFRIPIEKCVLGIYPRNEILLRTLQEVKTFMAKYESPEALAFVDSLSAYRKVYIYMPTWRSDGSDIITAARIDFARLEAALQATNSVLMLKLHPYTRLNVSVVELYPHIILFKTKCDINAILPFTDCLITDYSSVYCDYLLMGKEVILFPFDLDEYQKNSCGLEDYEKYYPGKRALTFDELLLLIEKNTDCHIPPEEYQFVMDAYWDSYDNGLDLISEITRRVKSNNK